MKDLKTLIIVCIVAVFAVAGSAVAKDAPEWPCSGSEVQTSVFFPANAMSNLDDGTSRAVVDIRILPWQEPADFDPAKFKVYMSYYYNKGTVENPNWEQRTKDKTEYLQSTELIDGNVLRATFSFYGSDVKDYHATAWIEDKENKIWGFIDLDDAFCRNAVTKKQEPHYEIRFIFNPDAFAVEFASDLPGML